MKCLLRFAKVGSRHVALLTLLFASAWSGSASAINPPATCSFVSQGDPNGTAGFTYNVKVVNPGANLSTDHHVYLEIWYPDGTIFPVPGDPDSAYKQRATNLLGSPYFWQRIKEYAAPNSSLTGSLSGTFTSVSGATNQTRDTVRNHVVSQLQSGNLPFDPLGIYVFRVPDAAGVDAGHGYHDTFSFNGVTLPFAVLEGGDMVLLDHEVTEATTDPLLNQWRDPQFPGEGEVSDFCNGLPTKIGSEVGHKVWSQARCACLGNEIDFDRDGLEDIVWHKSDTGETQFWSMNGENRSAFDNFTITGIPNIPDSTGWRLVGTADFNGDFKLDLLWRKTDGSVQVWYLNGAHTRDDFDNFTSQLVADSAGLNIIGTNDFNLDGKPDILWFNPTTRTALIWFMSGAKGLTRSSAATVGTTSAPLDWTIVGTADFNGDRKPDILWHNTNGANEVWYMDGPNPISAVTLALSVPDNLGWTVAATRDFNGDGKPDILWHNQDGTLQLWFMDGISRSSPADLKVLVNGQMVPVSIPASTLWKIAPR